MPTITISDELRDQLRAVNGPVELVDAAGVAVGWLQVNMPEPTPAELEADLAAPGRLTTAEVLERLRGLAK